LSNYGHIIEYEYNAMFSSEEYWIVAEPLRIEEARDALKDAVPELDGYLRIPV